MGFEPISAVLSTVRFNVYILKYINLAWKGLIHVRSSTHPLLIRSSTHLLLIHVVHAHYQYCSTHPLSILQYTPTINTVVPAHYQYCSTHPLSILQYLPTINTVVPAHYQYCSTRPLSILQYTPTINTYSITPITHIQLTSLFIVSLFPLISDTSSCVLQFNERDISLSIFCEDRLPSHVLFTFVFFSLIGRELDKLLEDLKNNKLFKRCNSYGNLLLYHSK